MRTAICMTKTRTRTRPRTTPRRGVKPTLDVAIEHATLVRGPAERVFDAFATAEGLDAWFTSGTSLEPHPGGAFTWRWKEWGPDRVTTTSRGEVVAIERPERFVFLWESGNETRTRVEISFEAVADGTVVRLRETGYADTPRGRRAFMNCASGWGEALTLAKFYVEHEIRY
ncbi:MAG: hypothetical protein A3K66_05850 [Euryarchaeota archaeon RBG_16_67_27]|nr:MAG: hypothetical protein A3K66_05850 [Euryarchaeota archaeon RBG_16_67_27]